jgi:hypothetical protein
LIVENLKSSVKRERCLHLNVGLNTDPLDPAADYGLVLKLSFPQLPCMPHQFPQ